MMSHQWLTLIESQHFGRERELGDRYYPVLEARRVPGCQPAESVSS